MLKTERYFSILLPCQVEGLRRLVLMLVEDQRNDEIRMTNDEGMTKSQRCVDFGGYDMRKLHGEINSGDHALRTGDSFAGNFKRSAVIGTGAGKRKAKRHIHALVKGVKFQRNQSLIVIHAEHRIEFTFNRSVKNCVGRMGAGENGT